MSSWLSNYPNPHAPGCFWHDITVKTGAPNVKWCEETLCGVISEPANTWSNILYLLIPLLIYQAAKKSGSKNLMTYPVVIFLMGAGSLIYHASNFYPTQILDFVGMFLFTGWALGMNLIRIKKLAPNKLVLFIAAYSIALTVVMHIMYVTMIKFQILVLFAGFAIIATEMKASAPSRRWLFISIALLVCAFASSMSDGTRLWCEPTNHFLQGHALWHVISGVAMWTIWRHYQDIFKADKALG